MISKQRPTPTFPNRATVRSRKDPDQELRDRDRTIAVLKGWIKALSPENVDAILEEVESRVK